jgi:hypothetical protein
VSGTRRLFEVLLHTHYGDDWHLLLRQRRRGRTKKNVKGSTTAKGKTRTWSLASSLLFRRNNSTISVFSSEKDAFALAYDVWGIGGIGAPVNLPDR